MTCMMYLRMKMSGGRTPFDEITASARRRGLPKPLLVAEQLEMLSLPLLSLLVETHGLELLRSN